jgi:chromosomal replication initiation ATPase DnaA
MTIEAAIAHCLHSGITERQVLGRCRRADVCFVRRHVMRLLHANGWSARRIGAYLHRHHATVLHALGLRGRAQRDALSATAAAPAAGEETL